MALSINRPGYAQIEAASHLKQDDEAWTAFMREVMQMPLSMLPAVRYAVKTHKWRLAREPIVQIRNIASHWEARRNANPAAAKGE